MSGPESLPEPLPVVDVSALRDRLQPRLSLYGRPISDELSRTLDIPHEGYSNEALLDHMHRAVGVAAESSARTQYQVIVRNTAQTYPDTYLDSPLLSPRQYVGSQDLTGSYRPEIRTTLEATVDSSRLDLVESLQFEDPSELVDVEFDDEVLQAALNAAETIVQAEITEAADRIEAALPINRKQQIIRKMLTSVGFNYDPAKVMPTDFRGSEQANLHRAMRRLTDLLAQSAASPAIIIDKAIGLLSGSLDESTAGQLTVHCEQRASIMARHVLPAELREAYDEAATKPVRQAPGTQARHRMEDNEDDLAKIIEETEAELEATKTVSIPNPFSWVDKSEVSVTLHRSGDLLLLSCEALSSNSQDISGRLRRDPRVAKRFDGDRSFIEEVEMHGLGEVHPRIKPVYTTERTPDDLSVHQYGNARPNAGRICYARALAEKYPQILEAFREQGVDEQTRLVVFMIETDKANQVESFKDLNIDPQAARHRNAGSV